MDRLSTFRKFCRLLPLNLRRISCVVVAPANPFYLMLVCEQERGADDINDLGLSFIVLAPDPLGHHD